MSELAATAERLRTVKDACLDFITLWALDRLLEDGRSSDRIHRDVICAIKESKTHSILQSDRRLDD